ncbi:MAG: 30S ribosomal protein S3 [Nanoarchaeota archaeon]|nr:30S ribosomal protein S3 [Nanoarchaeota archaeon]
MIEREIINQKIKEFKIQEFVSQQLSNVGLSHTKIQRTPVGEKIVIYASRPGLIIGGGGSNIKKLTKDLKRKFGLENPQIEINEIPDVNLIAQVVAERIVSSLERFGSMRFKGVGHKVMQDVMGAGAQGVEILISGKIPSARARVWRFYQGYLKKCGDVAISKVDKAYASAKLKTGIVGIQVSIMPPGTILPDHVTINSVAEPVVEEIVAEETGTEDEEQTVEKAAKEEKAEKPKRKTKKAAAAKESVETKSSKKTDKTN